jgi:hypothetical protein
MAYQLVPCKYCKRIFKTEYVYWAYEPGVKEQLVEMATNGSGIRDTARVLGIGGHPRPAGMAAVMTTFRSGWTRQYRHSLPRP